MKRILTLRTLTLCVMAMMGVVAGVAQERTDITIKGAVGNLVGRVELPKLGKGEKCHMVILCHGFMGNMESPILNDLASDLLSHGIGVVQFDFDGHGKSEGAFEDMTVPKEIDDLKSVIAWTAEQPYTLDISLAGHSQGGVVASMVAGEYGYPRIRSLALLAAAAVLRDDALRGICMGAHYDAYNVPETVTLVGDKKLGREYVLTAQKLPIYETALRYTGPVYIIQGTHDTIVPYTYAERFHAGYKDSRLELVDGEDHGFGRYTKEDALKVCDFFVETLSGK